MMITAVSGKQDVQVEQTSHSVLVSKERGGVGRDGSEQTDSSTPEMFQDLSKG